MVERVLSMHEAQGSIPWSSTTFTSNECGGLAQILCVGQVAPVERIHFFVYIPYIYIVYLKSRRCRLFARFKVTSKGSPLDLNPCA